MFLIDENLSPKLARYLRAKMYPAKAVRDVGLRGKSDEEVLKFAKQNHWVVVTSDVEFGKFFYERFGEVSIIILKSRYQNVHSFKRILNYLDARNVLKSLLPQRFLIVATDGHIRIRKYET